MNKETKLIILLFLFAVMCACMMKGCKEAKASDITLQWDNPNNKGVIIKYGVYIGVEKGKYTRLFTVDNETQKTLTISESDLEFDNSSILYFVVTGIDAQGIETIYSEELKYTRNKQLTAQFINTPHTTCTICPICLEASTTTYIIDTNDNGTSSAGRWRSSASKGSYMDGSKYARESSATYEFAKTVEPGMYTVYVYFTYYKNRCRQVPYEIWDNGLNLRTLTINQRDRPLAGQWVSLGSYCFSERVRVGIQHTAENALTECSTSVDAIKIVKQ